MKAFGPGSVGMQHSLSLDRSQVKAALLFLSPSLYSDFAAKLNKATRGGDRASLKMLKEILVLKSCNWCKGIIFKGGAGGAAGRRSRKRLQAPPKFSSMTNVHCDSCTAVIIKREKERNKQKRAGAAALRVAYGAFADPSPVKRKYDGDHERIDVLLAQAYEQYDLAKQHPKMKDPAYEAEYLRIVADRFGCSVEGLKARWLPDILYVKRTVRKKRKEIATD